MANESLLLQLTQLVDSYTLRQKRASAVQSTFKLVTNAHNKTLKALRDYAEHATSVDVQGAQAAFARVRVREEAIDPLTPDLRRESKTLAALIAALKESATSREGCPGTGNVAACTLAMRQAPAIPILRTLSIQPAPTSPPPQAF